MRVTRDNVTETLRDCTRWINEKGQDVPKSEHGRYPDVSIDEINAELERLEKRVDGTELLCGIYFEIAEDAVGTALAHEQFTTRLAEKMKKIRETGS